MLFSKISAIAVSALALFDGALAQNKFPVVGVQTGIVNGKRPPRRDIRDLFNDKPAFSLFVQALNALMASPENDIKSYFSAAEIHGRPYRAWDGVNPVEMGVDGIPEGYCPHGNVLFGVWHRPYLLLIEQLIAEKGQAIAKSYNSQQWRKVADQLRLPFWDWALPPVFWPMNILSTVNVTITTPSGNKVVSNPFYRYKFQGVPYPATIFNPEDPLTNTPTTLRSPHNGVSQDQSAAEEFTYVGPGYTRGVWNVFAKTSRFNTMTTWSTDGADFEGMHGGVHIITGGHMGPPDWTAYDPLFWFHHTTVDRQIAMWQAIYPDSFVEPGVSAGGTWTIYPGSNVTATTRLAPFTQGDRITPHTANSVRHIANLGYSYADIPSHVLSGAALSANVTKRVNQLYNPDGILTKRGNAYKTRRQNDGFVNDAGQAKDWTVNVKVPNGATGQGFTITFTLRDAVVGQVSVLAAPSDLEVAAGGKKITNSEFSLGEALDGVQNVEKAIKEGLKWTVVNTDGSNVPSESVTGLKIVIAEQNVELAVDENSFPKFGNKIYHPEILG